MRVKHILLLALLAVALANPTAKTSAAAKKKSTGLSWHKLPPAGERDVDDIYGFVDHGLREKYWYYLTKACLIYVAAVERSGSFQFLAVYRNIVGTFLAITTWQNQSSTFDVNTLVRLGNGYAKNSNANYKPVKLGLARFRYSLGPGQFLIDVSDCGDVTLNGKELSNNLDENLGKHRHGDNGEELVEKCKEFSEFTRKKFWYYLQDAHVVYSSVGSTAERDYCLVTYVNVAGTFFVIGSDGRKDHVCEVNTFVRLGNGYEEDSEANYKPVNFQKVTLPLVSYED